MDYISSNRKVKMKKRLVILLAFLAPLVFLFINHWGKGSELRDIELFSSYEEFSYDELKDVSSVIALIKVKDNLNVENSTIMYNDETPDIKGFFGTRSVEVIKFFKNDGGYDKHIKVIEPAVITEHNEYMRTEGYEKMEKGNYYLVFLSDDNATNQLSIISANNGKIDLSNIENNEYLEIAYQVLSEYNLDNLIKRLK